MGDEGVVFPDQTTSTSRPEEQPVRIILVILDKYKYKYKHQQDRRAASEMN